MKKNDNLNRHGIPRLRSNIIPRRRVKRDKMEEIELHKIEMRRLVFAKSRFCYYCGIQLRFSKFTIDHFVARFHGGSNDLSNLVPCCKFCNELKDCLTIEQFRRVFSQHFESEKFYFETTEIPF